MTLGFHSWKDPVALAELMPECLQCSAWMRRACVEGVTVLTSNMSDQ